MKGGGGGRFLQIKVVQLEPNSEEYENPKTSSKSFVHPVKRRLSPTELGNYDRGPSPERALENDNHSKSITRPNFQGNVHSVNPVLYHSLNQFLKKIAQHFLDDQTYTKNIP